MFTKYLVDQKHSKTLILQNANRTVTIAVTTASPVKIYFVVSTLIRRLNVNIYVYIYVYILEMHRLTGH